MTDKANEVKTEISTRDCYQVSYFIQVCTRVSTVKPTEDEVYEAAGRISSEVTQALHDYLVTCDQWVQLNHGRCITERDYEVIPNSGGIENILAERIVSVDHVRETDSFRFEDLEEEYRGKGFGKLLMRCLPVDTSSDGVAWNWRRRYANSMGNKRPRTTSG